MLPRNHPDRIKIAFDDHRLVANAGLLLPATFVDSGTKKGRAVGRLRPSEWRYGPHRLWDLVILTSSPGSSALLPLLSPARSRR